MKILPGGCHGSIELERVQGASSSPGKSPGAAVSDQVSLSRLYTSIKSNETALRLQTLELQVAQHTYWIPSAGVSRSLIDEAMIAT